MFLSDRDLEYAVANGDLIVNPAPTAYDTTSIDLHLDVIDEAKVWHVAAYEQQLATAGAADSPTKRIRFLRWQTLRVAGPLREMAQHVETGPIPLAAGT